MATFKINQDDNEMLIFATGETERSTIWENRGTQSNPDFHNTKEPKSVTVDGEELPEWKVKVNVVMPNGSPINKIIIHNKIKPEPEQMAPLAAENLRVDSNGRLFADALRPKDAPVTKFGGDNK